jgi:hypothetical protein
MMLDGSDRIDAPEAGMLPEPAPRAVGPRILDVDLRGVDLSDQGAVRKVVRSAQPMPPGPERDRALAALAEVKSTPGEGAVRTLDEQMAHLRRLHGRG